MTDIDFASAQFRLAKIFHPHANRRIREIIDTNTRFVHYTSANAAMEILKTKTFWMRKTSCMNDFMEVQYGLNCLNNAYRGEVWKKLRKTLNSIIKGISDEIDNLFENLLPYLQSDIYIACFSEHLDDEDRHGRLSMWRAYSESTGVAFVLNNAPFLSEFAPLKVYTSPVAYFDNSNFQIEFERVVSNIEANRSFLLNLERNELVDRVLNALKFAALCIKHPGFKEEKEWRVIYIPSMEKSEHLEKGIKVIDGTPQPIYKIPLKNVPNEGIGGIEIPEILDRIIIGPTEFPDAIQEGFVDLLTDAGVADPEHRVWLTGIPLRH